MVRPVPAPEIDVVILSWNDGPTLSKAVRSALTSQDVAVRVVVVDNGSDEPPGVPDDERVRVLRSPRNLGVSVGRTVGVMETTAPVVAFLDSDAALEPATLARLAAVLTGDPSIGLVAPVFFGQAPEASGGAAPGLLRKLQRVTGLSERYAAPRAEGTEGAGSAAAEADVGLREVDFAIGACQVFRREAWDRVGGLDTTIFYGPEDVDFCLRLRLAGYRVVQVLDAWCHHPPRRRFRRVWSRRGAAHTSAVLKHVWRHRRTRARLGR